MTIYSSDTEQDAGRPLEKRDDFENAIHDFRQTYGLSQDPFDSNFQCPFFTGAQRREVLDQLVHLCQFGQGISLLVAEPGVGKTCVALALCEVLGASQVCYMAALPTFDESNLVHVLVEYFGLDARDSLLQVTEALKGKFQGIAEDSGVLLVDDADHLADEVLLALFEQAGGPTENSVGLKMVLIGSMSLEGRVHNLLADASQINEVYLEPFTLAEAVDYLNFRMEMADYLGAELFNEANTEPWWRQSQGSLPKLHKYAQGYLFQTTIQPETGGARKTFPLLHILAVAALASLVVTIWLYQDDEQNDSPFVDMGLPRKETPMVDIPLAAPSRAVSDYSEAISSSGDLEASSSQAPPSIVSIDPVQMPKMVDSEGEVQSADVGASSQSSVPTQLTLENKRPRQEVAKVPDASPAPAAKPAPVAQRARSLSVDEQTLLSWNESDYTIQILGVSAEKSARSFMAEQMNRNGLLLFKTQRQGKDWFVVVFGRYSDSAAARAAINTLPSNQVSSEPWVRSLQGIHVDLQR